MSRTLTQEIIKFWSTHPSVVLNGLTLSSDAYIVSELIKTSDKKNILLIAPTSDDASKLYQSLKFFLNKTPLSDRVDLFSGWEHSPFLSFAPSIKNRIRRLKTLFRARNNSLRCIVTDVSAIVQKCPDVELLSLRSFRLSFADFIERDELINKLNNAGYLSSDPVEDVGTYSIRGNILDVYSPLYNFPVRIEFFGDEIEKIRFFDATTQRSENKEIEFVEIIPVSDFAVNIDSIQLAKAKTKEFCDLHDIPKKTRDQFNEALDLRLIDAQIEYLSAFFNQKPLSNLTHHLKNSWDILTVNTLDLDGAQDVFYQQIHDDFKSAIAEKKIVCPVDELFITREEFSEILNKKTLSLNALEVGLEIKSETTEQIETTSRPLFEQNGTANIKVLPNNDLLSHTKEPLVLFEEKNKIWTDGAYLRVFISTTQSQSERIQFLMNQKNIPSIRTDVIDWQNITSWQIIEGGLTAGFRIPSEKIVFVTDSEVFGQKKAASKQKREASPYEGLGSFVSSLDDLASGDAVVHLRHGIGKYRGLTKLVIDSVPQDFLFLEYAGSDKLYLPVYRLDQVQKYLGSEAANSLSLDKLGSGNFEKTKEKVKASLQEIAHKLLQLYAERGLRPGFHYSPPDENYRAFEARFPFAETPDQLKAIDDILKDMASEKIMDRLVCGDVGYGKTEVAMRAAYKAILDGKQVAVLVPTTVLALQHERSFKERFKDTAVRIEAVSRFKTNNEIKKTLADVSEKRVDILIGTHRLLSKDVHFQDLGLMIVDEEQRFGVEHKEKLKTLKLNTDVLTLTATPIPRTLQFSLMGLRDISIINTPPVDRLAVRTYIARFNESVIKKAIEQEMSRGGQVFFLHNRVQGIHAMLDRIKSIVPKARIILAHGQMNEGELEEKMLQFYNHEADVLLCTSIIESGLDIPSANTMIINRADMFGLSQLYQLRGRVGRSQLRAYCYLLLPEEGLVTNDAKQRLEIIQRFADLGSGFKVASHDLELRGGGDILGKNQSGHIAQVGYELFMDLLEETIQDLRGKPVTDHFDPEIKLPVPTLIPEEFVPDIQQRLHFYKKLSDAKDADSVQAIETEMQDRYGKLPDETIHLLWLIRIKQLLKSLHIKTLVCGKEKTSLEASKDSKISVEKALQVVRKNPNKYLITPESKIILSIPFDSPQRTFHEIENFLSQVAL